MEIYMKVDNADTHLSGRDYKRLKHYFPFVTRQIKNHHYKVCTGEKEKLSLFSKNFCFLPMKDAIYTSC